MQTRGPAAPGLRGAIVAALTAAIVVMAVITTSLPASAGDRPAALPAVDASPLPVSAGVTGTDDDRGDDDRTRRRRVAVVIAVSATVVGAWLAAFALLGADPPPPRTTTRVSPPSRP